MDKRLIEETFPVKEISAESAKEKSIRFGHISTLHIWWARRPLASSRATTYAALVPPPKNDAEWQKQRNFIIDLSKWDNSNNISLIEKAKAEILSANGNIPPKVLDPFGGGGSIPLESLRLGCETYSNDYNPVAVFIQKCTLEYPQKYGRRLIANDKWGNLSQSDGESQLEYDVKKWGNWVLDEASKELSKYYPPNADGSTLVGYLWARTIPCQNPSCGTNIPLLRQLWLVKRTNKKLALYPYPENGDTKFKIVGDGHENIPDNFNPDTGTVARAVVTCPICGNMIDADTTRKLFQDGKSGHRMIAGIYHKAGRSGKIYKIANQTDENSFDDAEAYFNEKESELRTSWGIEPVPNEPITRVPVSFGVINVWVYGMTKWGDLYNSRQKLSILIFSDFVRQAYNKMISEGYTEEYSKVITSYLAISVDNIAEKNNVVSRWANTKETIAGSYSRQALPMVWDYFESNPLSGSTGDWKNSYEYNIRVIKNIGFNNNKIKVTQSSATALPYSDNFFDAVFTDPPYYDNVPYSYLSDFFYVWLKRTIGNLYPELFTTPLTPKKNEIVAYMNETSKDSGKHYFEDMLKKSFKEIFRTLKPNGIVIIVYAHKSTEGWETLINSLLDSGLIVTEAWPINTEMGTRLRANESAALASSIYIIARKMERQSTGFYNNVKEELKTHLNKKLDKLWQEGVSGADFFIAAIGSAIEIYGKYEQVIDYEGNTIRADRLLEDVRKISTDYAVKHILHNGFAGEITDLTRLYVLWRWNYGEGKVPFDEARKLGQSCGIDITREWIRSSYIKKDKEFVRVLGPQDRSYNDYKDSKEMIDVLHSSLLLWEKSKHDELVKTLQISGYGTSEAFYRVAQAISETLPNDSKEKKLLDGFLVGKERIKDEIRGASVQTKLDV